MTDEAEEAEEAAVRLGDDQAPVPAACPGCALLLPADGGPTHRYMTASPACWRSFSELLATCYGDPDRLEFRQLIVDAYAAQHPGEGLREQVQSVGIHLMTLCLFLEHGVDPSQGSKLHQRMIRRPNFHQIEPQGRTDLTVQHVPLVGPAEDARERAYAWSRAVWKLYADDHDVVRVWLNEAGFQVE